MTVYQIILSIAALVHSAWVILNIYRDTTIKRMEEQSSIQLSSLSAIQGMLERKSIEFDAYRRRCEELHCPTSKEDKPGGESIQ